MAFDPQTEDQPLVNVRRRTTKVNIAVAIGVVVFLIIAIGYVISIARSPAETRQEMHEETTVP